MRSFKTFSVYFVSLFFLFLPQGYLNSCGFSAPVEGYRVWLFQPNLPEIKTLLPYAFSYDKFYAPYAQSDPWYEGGTEPYFDKTFYQTNVEEWQQAIGKHATTEDIHALLYDVSPDSFLTAQNTSLGSNTFLKALKTNSNATLYRYFAFAKECESIFNRGEWDEPASSESVQKVLNEGTSLLADTQNSFVKFRTAYMVQKLYWFQNEREKSLTTYEKYIAPQNTQSWLKASALFYKALCFDDAQRELWLARAFDQSQDKRLRAMQLFRKDNLKTALNIAPSNHDKAVMLFMQEIKNPGRALPTLQEIYTLSPDYADFKWLVGREINKLEDWLWTSDITSYSSTKDMFSYDSNPFYAYRAEDIAYLQELGNLVEQVIEEGKQTDSAFWHLAATHLAFMSNDLDHAQEHLEKLNASQLSPMRQIQKEIAHVLIAFAKDEKSTENVSRTIPNLIATIDQSKAQLVEYDALRGQVLIFLADQFLRRKQVAPAFFLYAKTNRLFGSFDQTYSYRNAYQTLLDLAVPADYDAVIQLIQKPNKSRFEQFLTSAPIPYNSAYDLEFDATKNLYLAKDYQWNETTWEQELVSEKYITEWDINKIKDFKATWYVRHNQLLQALAVFKSIPDTYWQQEPYASMLSANPFYVDTRTPHITLKADALTFTKTAFIETMLRLQEEAENNPSKRGINHYLLANAYYNMSHFGNFWLMTHIAWSNGDTPQLRNWLNDQYFGLKRATEHYEACLENAEDETLASLCARMADFGKQRWETYQYETSTAYTDYYGSYANHEFSYQEYYSEQEKQPIPITSHYGKKLQERFKNTSTYQKLGTCDGYEDYINKYNLTALYRKAE